ncbi:putative secretion ATPase (PEP-CTERM system associated) [Massilia aurea]|jgi:general secretion pathway protein A|uniref:Putative secretion ATPase (PEP-CTERM system associated) n=1 Tax=Massilia aurea TaxID=373040 RepID=A0A7X0CEQ1_9BURK|nr:XrtA/PEP-CTERM system-associated ATPase [Massilia aurea]MBB6134278.1 putative secretion ATPase (PEP-CTERM system associated) [Massilia aurea]
MYESYYGLSAKPFQLRPDPHFFYGSKGHKRAMAYLEYGLSQGEGFIVITGEVGAGKTTLVRNMLGKLPLDQIVAAHIVNTSLDPEDTLRMVVSSFGLPYEGQSKAELLNRLEQFLRTVDRQGKRALLVIDEAQNLNARTVEELRMLSNFQTDERSLLQTFLLGQPEFRATLHSPGMQQLRQRVIASYHLGPMDAAETRAYVEHRLATVGWQGTPSFDDGAYSAIYAYSGGIPRKTNTLMDRVLLMGYLEELQAFTEAHINDVVRDISEEFDAPDTDNLADADQTNGGSQANELHPGERRTSVEQLDERMMRLEKSIVSVLSILKKIAATPPNASGAAPHHPDHQE